MNDGIYFITFRSSLSEYGEATIVVKDGVINGGNYVCVYHGKVTGKIIELTIKRHDHESAHALGYDEECKLILVLRENNKDCFMLGSAINNSDKKIEASAKYIGDLLF
ncbi:hypothetical protein M2263_000452 [Providencia alcalifaciens]|nr:hypothetical protein [Providencia alcalifaciens]